MPEQTTTQPGTGHNSQDAKIAAKAEQLRPLLNELERLGLQRAAINKRAEAVRAKMDVMGLNRRAIRAARAAAGLTENQLDGFDTSYQLARLALERPLQTEMDLAQVAAKPPKAKTGGKKTGGKKTGARKTGARKAGAAKAGGDSAGTDTVGAVAG